MSAGPVPIPTPETQTFWEGTAIGELRIQRCNSCEEYYFYPRPYCPGCQSDDVEWRVVSGKGTLASYNINYRPFPIFESKDPQVIALVELDEGVRMMSNIVDVEPLPDEDVDWQDIADDIRPVVGQFLEACDRCADELLDVEHRTAMRRFLRRVAIAESPAQRRDVFSHNAGSTGARDYAALHSEFLRQKLL